MPLKTLYDNILSINPSNDFIKYFSKRILRNNYRGIHISQHNRYNIKYILTLIRSIYNNTGGELFEIPPGDYSEKTGKKDYSLSDYPIYKSIVDEINLETGKGTYNSVKKNFFVDLERMKLLYRDRIENRYYAQLTENAINLLEKNDFRLRVKLFTDLIDENLFSNYLSDLVEFLFIYGYDCINIYEYTFILNDFYLKNFEKDNLLKSFRHLTSKEKNKLIEVLKEYANPIKFLGFPKNEKRDFENWINESQQIFSLLKYTTYFSVIKKDNLLYLCLNTTTETGIFEIETLKRSAKIKSEYFKLHKVPLKEGFDLHHIIPIKVAVNKKDMELIDNVNNLLYIDNNIHKKIHKNKTYKISQLTTSLDLVKLKNIKNNKKIVFSFNENNILVSKNETILKDIKNYNEYLIKKYEDKVHSIS